MNQKKVIIFDLDGTITNSSTGIFNSLLYALNKFGINTIPSNVRKAFIGPSLKYSFSKYFFTKEEEVENAIKYYREYYSEKGLYENELYPGIIKLLKKLNVSGRSCCIASSKPKAYVLQILRHFKINDYFKHIASPDMDDSSSEKESLILQIMQCYPDKDPDQFVMIGDRYFDVTGAKLAGIEVIGVNYGYGGKKELFDSGAYITVDNVEELRKILFTRNNNIKK